jgi:flagellar motor protein MotB
MGVLRRRRSTDHFEVDTEGSWAISYGDMITLLLSFFILFFSTDSEKDRLQAMEASLLVKLENRTKPDLVSVHQPGQDPQFDPTLINHLAASVHKVGQKLIIEFPKVSFFDLGKVELTKMGKHQLKQFVDLYMPYAGNYIVGIRAYTDNKKVRPGGNRFQDNLELSALRSVATMRALQSLGIPMNRMRLGGYGELRMTAEDLGRAIASVPDYDRNGLALARKIVLVIEPEPKETL